MPISEKKHASNVKWDSANLERISLAIPKGKGKLIREAAAASGESLNAYITNAAMQRIEKERES